eukprot:14716678-Alexandrium_andersonii.AAC.1
MPAKKSATRDRYRGSHTELVTALRPVVFSRGRSFVTYNEAPTAAGARVDTTAIREAHEVLSAAHSLQSNLSFPRSVLHSTVRDLYTEFAADPAWSLKASDVGDYCSTMQ